MTAALVVEDLYTTFTRGGTEITAVRGVTLSVAAGETMTVLGESGSGKSVTVRSILRLHNGSARTTGRIQVAGVDVLTMNPRQLTAFRGRQVAMVPQDPTAALDPLRTVGAQLTEVIRWHGVEKTRRAARTRAADLLGRVGISDPVRAAGSYPHELSGGMRQRVMIAIAVSCEPAVLLADEPTTALDVTVQAQILELFADLQQEFHTALLLITHDVGVAKEVGGRIGVMYAGRLVESGRAQDVLRDPSHPYTRGLLDCIPDPEVDRGMLRVIAGRPPLPGEQLSGCPFAPRCDLVTADCHTAEPPAYPLPHDRSVACLLQAPKELAWTP
ncbi:MAG TPA: ABC transporter ATP-binding protein [Mycobacteriales bacterium]|nr:ABC transporter ATP-binding protein [Mycobacteriales bacterium]